MGLICSNIYHGGLVSEKYVNQPWTRLMQSSMGDSEPVRHDGAVRNFVLYGCDLISERGCHFLDISTLELAILEPPSYTKVGLTGLSASRPYSTPVRWT